MIPSALMAWLHYVSIFAALGLLVAELVLYQPDISEKLARRFGILDGLYGVAALAIVGTGFARAAWFEKGWSFYEMHPVFWTKVGVYLLWAFLSLPPTVHFFSLRKAPSLNGRVRIELGTFGRIRGFMIAQLCLAPVPPLLGALLARGVGAPI